MFVKLKQTGRTCHVGFYYLEDYFQCPRSLPRVFAKPVDNAHLRDCIWDEFQKGSNASFACKNVPSVV